MRWGDDAKVKAPPTSSLGRANALTLTAGLQGNDSGVGRARPCLLERSCLKEGVECLLSGEVEIGKAVLRDFINATIGFHQS